MHINMRFPPLWTPDGDLLVVQLGNQEIPLYSSVNITCAKTKEQFNNLHVVEVMACKAQDLTADYLTSVLGYGSLKDFLATLSKFYGTSLPVWADVVIYRASRKAPSNSDPDLLFWDSGEDEALDDDVEWWDEDGEAQEPDVSNGWLD